MPFKIWIKIGQGRRRHGAVYIPLTDIDPDYSFAFEIDFH